MKAPKINYDSLARRHGVEAGKLRATLTPWSSVVGHSITLSMPGGPVVAQLAVLSPAGPPDGKSQRDWLREVGEHVCRCVNEELDNPRHKMETTT